MSYSSINIQGNIVSSDILTKIRQEDIRYQTPADFGLDRNTSVREEIGLAWSNAQNFWKAFKQRRDRLKETDSGTSETRQGWMIPFLRELGYDLEAGRAEILNGKSYAISHRAANKGGFPVHIVGVNQSLDKRAEGGARLSPHALAQEYLNNTEHLYAITTNGTFLRILRDATRLSRLSYLEFDLARMMEDELYAEFALLFRVMHASRMPQKQDAGAECILEFYHQEALASGTRIREGLRNSVEKSLQVLANGILMHPANSQLRADVLANRLTAQAYQSQLLRLVYRLLFLLVIEERNALYPSKPSDDIAKKRDIYNRFYSLRRLTKLAQSRIYVDPRKTDLWESLMATFSIFEFERHAEKLGLQALGSGIFAPNSLQDLNSAMLNNEHLLLVLKHLTTIQNQQNQLTVVNYADLDVEEFGSVYEGLLDLHPYIQNREDGTLAFGFVAGTERKETGSYYTNHDLVGQLIKTALEPLVDERLKPLKTRDEKLAAILDIKVCDPACGSGHFLLAAARKLATRYAQESTGEENPGKEPTMEAMRNVIQHCIYGVDKNPAAVELCKVALWIEGHSTGKPLSFLDHRIRPGDSLVGVDKLDRLKEGIPDGAFKETTGDDKSIAQGLKKQNKTERESKQVNLFFGRADFDADTQRFAQGNRAIEALAGDTLDEIARQQKQFEAARANQGWWKNHTACNLFAYAFFQEYLPNKALSQYVTSQYLANYLQSAGSLNAQLEAAANTTAQHVRFFHWPLEYPEIAEKGGFDVMLGNPPWERIKLQEKEFFLGRDQKIVSAKSSASRKKLIAKLKFEQPSLFIEYLNALHLSEASSKFIRESSRFPLASSGDVNTYPLFTELLIGSINPLGGLGVIIPAGIATDSSTQLLFKYMINEQILQSLIGFENEEFIFPTVHHAFKFCALTLHGSERRLARSQFTFLNRRLTDLDNKEKWFELSSEELTLFNPNTQTCPVFRNKADFAVAKQLYYVGSTIINDQLRTNFWGIEFHSMFHMSNDSQLFSANEMAHSTPLYESKLFHQFNHRYTSYEGATEANIRQGTLPQLTQPELSDAFKRITPNYWVEKSHVKNLSLDNWHIAYRSIASANNERTFIAAIVPFAAISNSAILIKSNRSAPEKAALLAMLNSMVFDFVVRLKQSGNNLNFFIVKQLPVLTPSVMSSYLLKITPTVLELVFASWDIKAFADDIWKEADEDLRKAITRQWEANKAVTGGHAWQVPAWADAYPEIDWQQDGAGCPLPPFRWDEERRAYLRAELDAYFALLYGLERDELRYILDPQDVHGPDFPGETFRVLKEKETRKYGEYRTRRLVLAAYDRLRPTWDMEAHLAKLKEIWEECQVDLSEKKKAEAKKAAKPATKPKEVLPPREDRRPQIPLFGEEPLTAATVKEGSRVTIKSNTGSTFHYVILRNAVKGQFTGEYKQIATTSGLAEAMLGLGVGDGFEFGGVGYEVIGIL